MQITTRIGCKVNCNYCPQDKIIEQYKNRSDIFSLSFDDFKTCVDKIPLEIGIEFGGMSEPWLNPECTKMLLYTHETNHKILVKTTLVGMSTSDVEMMEQVPFKLFQIHLPSVKGSERIPVNEDYLAVLDRIIKSPIDAMLHYHGEALNPEVAALLKRNGKEANPWALHRRAGSMKVKHRPELQRRRGKISCKFDMRSNILLPNGDVLVCANDYGMKHVLENLIVSDYDSLFQGEEFKKLKKGQKDDSLDILCRYCDDFCYSVGFFAKANNWRYSLDHFSFRFRDKHGMTIIGKIWQKTISTFKVR